MTRASFSLTTAGAALAALLTGPNGAEAADTSKRTIVLTGANSGIGLDAATKLVSLYRACVSGYPATTSAVYVFSLRDRRDVAQTLYAHPAATVM